MNPETIHIHGYKVIFSSKGNTAKAQKINSFKKRHIKAVDFVNHMRQLGYILSEPNPKEPSTLVFRKQK